jgi:hypothetical protein
MSLAIKKKLVVTFSGGKTSAYMSKLLLDNWSEQYEMIFIFANTGQEREETLVFVKQCDDYFKLNLVWVEADVVTENGAGTRHKIVNFETASRNGKPFEQVIEKYGISNQSYPHCTRELKISPINHYIKSIGWVDYEKAVGIRADEKHRYRDKPKYIYPLILPFNIDKTQVNAFWESMPFNLNLKAHEGNCAWCWKKSKAKHFALIRDNPQIYDFPRRMEEKYGLSGSNFGVKRVFFRGNQSTDELFASYKLIASDLQYLDRQIGLFQEDADSGCTESCEAFAGEEA